VVIAVMKQHEYVKVYLYLHYYKIYNFK
jgi:hypothetical protein